MARDRMRDEFDDDLPARGPLPLTPARLARARSRVKAPAVLLIVHAILGLLFTAYGVTQLGKDQAAEFRRERAKAEANMNAEQREQLKDFYDGMEKVMEGYGQALPVLVGLSVVVSLLTLLGAVSMLRLSSGGLSKLAALLGILSVVGCGSGCCLLGLAGGIWSFVAMADPDVKAAFAAGGQAALGRDDDSDDRDPMDDL
jgi:hypothetical protein